MPHQQRPMGFWAYTNLLWHEFWADWLIDARIQIMLVAGGILAVWLYQHNTGKSNTIIEEAVRVGAVGLAGGLMVLVVYHAVRAPWRLHLQNSKQAEASRFEDLMSLTNRQLRVAALDFAKEVRAFEAVREEEQTRFGVEEGNRLIKLSGQQRHHEAALARATDDQLHAAYVVAFKTKFLADALALRNELLRRHGIAIPQLHGAKYFSIVLDREVMVAGQSMEAIKDIESLARALP